MFSSILFSRRSLAAVSAAVIALSSLATAAAAPIPADACRLWFALEGKVWIYNCIGDCPGTAICNMISHWDPELGFGSSQCTCGSRPANGSACNGIRVQQSDGTWWIDCVAASCDSGCTNPVFGPMPSPSCDCR